MRKKKKAGKGISGAPVFRGHTLIAVLTHTPENMNERLRAVSMPYLLSNVAEFRELTGIGHRSHNFNHAKKTLQENREVKIALYTQISHNINVPDSAAQIIDYLATIPIPELINTIHSAQKNNPDKTVRRVLARLLCENVAFAL